MVSIGDKALLFRNRNMMWLEETSSPSIGDKGFLVRDGNAKYFLRETLVSTGNKGRLFNINNQYYLRSLTELIYGISGYIYNEYGIGISNEQINITGYASYSINANPNGNFTFQDNINISQNYMIRPENYLSFEPPKYEYSPLLESVTNQNFHALSISGKTYDWIYNPITLEEIDMIGSKTTSRFTNNSGFYIFGSGDSVGVRANESYKIFPHRCLTEAIFMPVTREYSPLGSTKKDQNFEKINTCATISFDDKVYKKSSCPCGGTYFGQALRNPEYCYKIAFNFSFSVSSESCGSVRFQYKDLPTADCPTIGNAKWIAILAPGNSTSHLLEIAPSAGHRYCIHTDTLINCYPLWNIYNGGGTIQYFYGGI